MIPKSVQRFSEKIMLKQEALARSKLGIGQARRFAEMRGADARRDELSPSAFRIVGETQYCEIRRGDHPRVEQHVEIDHLRPIAAVDANQRDGWSLASLHQRQ